MSEKAAPRRTVMQLVKSAGNNEPPVKWADLPEVRDNPNTKNKNSSLIEAKFEIIFQEAYFNYRIRTLLVAFFSSGKVKESDRKAIFASIEKVLRVSDVFLSDLEQCWQRDVFLAHVFDVIRKHESNFDVYVKHGATLKNTLQHLKKLKTEKKEFNAVIEQWKLSPENIYSLDLETFLTLPQDRFMSFIMSVESAALLVEKNDAEYKSSQAALKALRKLSAKCNFPATKPESKSQSAANKAPTSIFTQLTFADEVNKFQVEVPGRQVILIEELTLIRNSGNAMVKWAARHLILFNDVLLIASRQKRDERYTIEDYCQLSELEVKNTEDLLALMPDPALTEIQNKLLLIKLKENHERKPVLMLFSCAHEANCVSWQNLLTKQIFDVLPASASAESASAPGESPEYENMHREDTTDQQQQTSRTSQDMKIIEELKRKQEARKRMTGRMVTEEAAQYNPDGLYRPLSSVNEEDLAGLAGGDFQRSSEPPAPVLRDRGDDFSSNGVDRVSYQIPRATSHSVYTETSTSPAPAKKLQVFESSRRRESGVDAAIAFDRTLEYPPGMMVFPLVSSVRWIVKQGPIVQRWQTEERKSTENKVPMTLTLFNDVLFFTTQKKNEPRLKVMSYGMRNLVDITPVRRIQYLPSKYLTDSKERYMFMIHLLENHKRKEEIMVVSVPTASERDGWLNAVPSPPSLDETGERVFDPWDCPIVIVTQPYKSLGPNQLNLAVNDKIHVLRRRGDGWCEGERVSDGEAGLFPAQCTSEIDSPHKYAKSVRRRLQSIADGNR